MSPTTGRGFEEALSELESTVRRLEGGDLPLEEALRLFEEGVRLKQECAALLSSAERRITELVGTPDAPVERPLAP